MLLARRGTLNDDNPVPKSSSAKQQPSPFRVSMKRNACANSDTAEVSVISKQSLLGVRSVASICSVTKSRNSTAPSDCPETFIAKVTSDAISPPAASASRQVLITQRSSDGIKP